MSKGSDWAFAPRDEDAEEDPHTVMHVYEGDGGIIIRDGGNISTFGVQSRAVMAAFNAASEEPGPEHHVIADLAARLAKAERALEEANDWRPIETAPKDWTDVLTYTPPENHRLGVICGVHVGCFRTDLMVWHLSDDEWELAPTHWRPLPSPPKEGE
jgi:hypothetical protein